MTTQTKLSPHTTWLFAFGSIAAGIISSYALSGLGQKVTAAVDFAIVPDVDPPDALSISYLGRAREMLVTGERNSPLHGKPIDHPINRRAIALPLAELTHIPNVIFASGGANKVEAIAAALLSSLASALVCDEDTARAAMALALRTRG